MFAFFLYVHRTTLQCRRRTWAVTIVECAHRLWMLYWRKWSFHPPLPSRVAAYLPLPHWPSPLLSLPDQATLPQPSPVEDNSLPARQPVGAPICTWSPKLSDSKKAQAKHSKPTKGSYIIRKQTTNPYSLTKKFNILAAAVRKISNEICALQQQVCTLSTENLCLKPVIKNLKNQSTSPSKSTPECSYYPQVPTASNPLSPGRPKKK